MRKYLQGNKINSLDELYQQKYIWLDGKVYHCGWFCSWQLRCCYRLIDQGKLYTVIKNPADKTPTLYDQGYKACMEGRPYNINKPIDWCHGWYAASEKRKEDNAYAHDSSWK